MKYSRYLLSGLVIITGVIFTYRLFFLQVVDSDYRLAATNNVMKRIRTLPFRGEFYDRYGHRLVYNRAVYRVLVTPKDLVIGDTANFLRHFELRSSDLLYRLEAARRYSYRKPSVLISHVGEARFARFQHHLRHYSGIQIGVRMERGYVSPYVSHALGYMGEINRKALSLDTIRYYEIGDDIGITGIEYHYEDILRGEHGFRVKMVDVQGQDLGIFEEGRHDKPSVRGRDLVLSLDLSLQNYASYLMEGKRGSLIALDPKSGEILAFVSAPLYSPELLSRENVQENYARLAKDPDKPLFNRPLMAQYRPGSIFKVAQALVALELGVVDSTTYFSCDQSLIGCHAHGEGTRLKEALVHSCNPYFYRLMRRIIQPSSTHPYRRTREGLQQWRDYICSMGFGHTLGIDLPSEQAGLIPDAAYYDKIYGALRWKYSNIYSLSIGEGENTIVPLQMANFAALIANKGHYYRPHVLHDIPSQQDLVSSYKDSIASGISPHHFDFIHRAMRQVVTLGTGKRADIEDISVCGKTGSVETSGEKNHSVFISFAPQFHPRIALSVYVEHGGEGGELAAAISGLVIEKYLKKEKALLRLEGYVKGEFPTEDNGTGASDKP